MVEVAAHLTDHVLPPLPIRQWVLSVPKRIRPFFHHDPALAGAVLRVLLRAVRTRLRHGSPGAGPDARIGAVSFLHRFGSSLNPHFHFHVVVLDGVFTETVDGEVRFDEATHFSGDDARALTPVLQRRILRLFQRRGLLEGHTVDDMLTWQGTGGFSLDASVRIHGADRAGRERLLRYCARPPFALNRLRIERESRGRAGDAGVRRVFYQPARPTPDGRTLLALSPLEFLDALSRLIPPPRVHRHRYHGVLAPNARLRPHVVALGRDGPVEIAHAADQEAAAPAHEDPATPLTGAAARSRWAQLLARIYEVFPLRCPECGATMRILAFLTDPQPTGAILRHLDLPHTPPRLAPARGPPSRHSTSTSIPSSWSTTLSPPTTSTRRPRSTRPTPSPPPSSTSIRPAAPDRRATSVGYRAWRSSPPHAVDPTERAPKRRLDFLSLLYSYLYLYSH